MPEHSGEAITILKVDPMEDVGITLTSTAQRSDGRIEDQYTAYFDNRSPPLNWTSAPDVKAWAIIVEDPDAPREHPFIHWMIWNIEGGIQQLEAGLPNTAHLLTPQAAIQGKNDMGGYGYFGPRPPQGHGLHRYYFQIFALDDFIPMDEDTPLKELLNALKGNTIAKGELMMTYEAPTQQ
jgi:Raf kinase inhibitor-like YbhB/YbcL family protein